MKNFEINELNQASLKFLSEELIRYESKNRGLELFQTYSGFQDHLRLSKIELPSWIDDLESNEIEQCLKSSLIEINESDDEDLKYALKAAKDNLSKPQAQSFALSVFSVGTVLAILILASRVKSVGNGKVEFYKGIPSDLSKIFKEAGKIIRSGL